MLQDSTPRPTAAIPLWIIAVSLLVIAICLVVQFLQPAQKGESPVHSDDSWVAPSRKIWPTNNSLFPERADYRLPRAASPAQQDVPVAGETESAETLPSSQPVPGALFVSAEPAAGRSTPDGFLGFNGVGWITGHVSLRGTPPPETEFQADESVPCATEPNRTVITRNFDVNADGALQNALVYIAGFTNNMRSSDPGPVSALFVGCEIEPHVFGIEQTRGLIFRDSDGLRHRIHLKSSDGREKRIELEAHGSSQPILLTPRVLWRVTCDLHPWEQSFVRAFSHPYFATTDFGGKFIITNVPPGKYVLEADHPAPTGTIRATEPIVVEPYPDTEVEFTLDSPPTGNSRPEER